ncbi:TetR/AcrR family transcriptional regulator [Pseudoflavonifractor sp. MCC625]|uniref:TetR/AcrR family transcriptional regulator n=1 Tax=Pseudoflavonifractor sp. MCC625 TaxID=2592647 RepID=UPI002078523E|nr:TetR/AcrR family transcriptional regulator [Pseudoflavonifractor sp. MCC625]
MKGSETALDDTSHFYFQFYKAIPDRFHHAFFHRAIENNHRKRYNQKQVLRIDLQKGGGAAVPTDMKKIIAEATQTLLFERHVKKLTVKDIVEQCNITRQAFYYHFDGIPELLRWMIEEYFEQVMGKALDQEDGEVGLRSFFVMAINIAPYVEHGMKSNYGEELKRLLRQCFLHYFTLASERKNFYPDCTRSQMKVILRYHSQAIMGLLEEWTDEDTEQLDQIVHTVYHIMTAEIPPWSSRT